MVTLYLLSSFVGQLGPNCTTFLIPAEIFPTEQRTYCHGVCAAAGKVGALMAAVMFHNFSAAGESSSSSSPENLFFISGGTSFLAALVTHWFIPETSGLDLLELDVQWKCLLMLQQQQEQEIGGGGEEGSGRSRLDNHHHYHHHQDYQYNGPANHPDHLSVYERYCSRRRNANRSSTMPTTTTNNNNMDDPTISTTQTISNTTNNTTCTNNTTDRRRFMLEGYFS